MKVNNSFAVPNLENLYKNEEFSDVNFFLKNKAGEEIKIPAHRVILASSSSKWKKSLLGESVSKSITGVSAGGFEEFLQLFYMAHVDLTEENIAEVCKLIKTYEVPQCNSVCESFLKQTVKPENAFQYYEIALLFNLSAETIEWIEKLIYKEPSKCLKMLSTCSEIVIKKVLQSDKLKCDEFEIFDAVVLWATQALKYKGLSASALNIRAELGDTFNLIRFPIMNSKQFLGCLEDFPNLLQHEEYVDILHFIMDKRPLSFATNFNTTKRASVETSADVAVVKPPKDMKAIKVNFTAADLSHLYYYSKGETSTVRFLVSEIDKIDTKVFLTGFDIYYYDNNYNYTNFVLGVDLNGQFTNIHFNELIRDESLLKPVYKRYHCKLPEPILVRENIDYKLVAGLFFCGFTPPDKHLHWIGFGFPEERHIENVEFKFTYRGEKNHFVPSLHFGLERLE